jgi:hypothetical protein
MSKDKRPLIAGVLSFVLPGLGLLYVGYKRAAMMNFVLVNIALVVFTVFLGDPSMIEHVHWLFLGLAALSAGYAHGVAASKYRADSDWKRPISAS